MAEPRAAPPTGAGARRAPPGEPRRPPPRPAAPALAAAPGPALPPHVRTVVEATRGARLAPVKTARGGHAREPVLLIAVLRDEAATLPEFLAHYRGLGVGRFAIVDNGSTDGSAELLAAEPDVDLYTSAASFRWPLKQAWINRLIARYGYHRWYLQVDADEHLAFDGAPARGLAELVRLAEARGLRRLRGMLVDMYGAGPVLAPAPAPAPLAARFPYFDPGPYPERLVLGRISRTGGPRARAFSLAHADFAPELSKYPLFHIRPGEVVHGPHDLYPYRDSYLSPCLLALLHYKFTEGFLAKARRAVREASYWRASFEYRRYLEILRGAGGLALVYPGSRRYAGPADLVAAGLIEPIAWEPRPSALARLRAALGRPAGRASP